jgi:hypothetical protein
MNNTSDLLPQDKFDTRRAEAAVNAGYPAVEPFLPELLEWMQDCNWPVAQTLAPFLSSIGLPLAPHVKRILETNDYIWKYWIILLLMRDSQELAAAFRHELIRLVSAPTECEKQEGIDEVAQKVIQKHGWAN